ncbi:hypothetical protein OF83DRAFT_1067711 [Amylostereum chailletii]|nr:hypothetical protein OF83DRAFT_1067711 [Amylostereum chailletii]
MPEQPEVYIWKERFDRWVRAKLSSTGKWPQGASIIWSSLTPSEQDTSHYPGHLVIIPRIFATGTDTKSYTSCTVDRGDYSDDLEPIPLDFVPDPYDASRALGEPYEYLVKPLKPGPVFCQARGKQMCIGAGHHAVTISFGLEAHILKMSHEAFHLICSLDTAGPNQDAEKAEKLRRFVVPDIFIEPGTQPKDKREITIFLAFICEDCVWTLCDFSRLVRFHIISALDMWTLQDFEVGCPEWEALWAQYESGPDWITEREACLKLLHEWRASVLNDPGSSSGDGTIVDVMSNDRFAFNGFGRHLANDFCHLIAVWPGMPVYDLCADDELFGDLLDAIAPFMEQWNSEAFLRYCAASANTANPLSFNEWADHSYYSMYILVFWKSRIANIPPALYDKYISRGLLDPEHTIGTFSLRIRSVLSMFCNKAFKQSAVFRVKGIKDAYTIIRAKCPKEWTERERTVTKDLKQGRYATTIGGAEFHEPKANKINLKDDDNVLTHRLGRLPKVCALSHFNRTAH